MTGLPDPEDRPLLKPPELVGVVPGMKRSAIYEAIASGDIPSLRIRGKLYVPTAELRRAWGLDEHPPVGGSA